MPALGLRHVSGGVRAMPAPPQSEGTQGQVLRVASEYLSSLENARGENQGQPRGLWAQAASLDEGAEDLDLLHCLGL